MGVKLKPWHWLVGIAAVFLFLMFVLSKPGEVPNGGGANPIPNECFLPDARFTVVSDTSAVGLNLCDPGGQYRLCYLTIGGMCEQVAYVDGNIECVTWKGECICWV